MELCDIDDRRASELVEAVNDAQDLYNSASTYARFEVVEKSKSMLKAHLDDIKARNQYTKFVVDLHSIELTTKHLFRPPQQDFMQPSISGFRGTDVSITEDPVAIVTGHRQFWGQLSSRLLPISMSDLRHVITYSTG